MCTGNTHTSLHTPTCVIIHTHAHPHTHSLHLPIHLLETLNEFSWLSIWLGVSQDDFAWQVELEALQGKG